MGQRLAGASPLIGTFQPGLKGSSQDHAHPAKRPKEGDSEDVD